MRLNNEDLDELERMASDEASSPSTGTIQRNWRSSVCAYRFARALPALIAELRAMRAAEERRDRRGVLCVEIGIDTLAFSTLHSPIAYEICGDEASQVEIARRLAITNPRGFASDVKRELLAEAEDGSSLLTKLFDDACSEAIEQGSEHFIDAKYDEPLTRTRANRGGEGK